MYNLPKSISWAGCGKSRLSIVSFPDAVDEEENTIDMIVDEEENMENTYNIGNLCLTSPTRSIRTPVSIKCYKRSQPVLIVPKKHKHSRKQFDDM
jgi:hypothetical protein